jgi:hypothetical protein
MSGSRDTPSEGDRWYVNVRRVLFVTPPSTDGVRYVWHTQYARSRLQPTDRVDCIRASPGAVLRPEFGPDGAPLHSMKPPSKGGVGFKGGSVAQHVPALDLTPMDLQTPAVRSQRVEEFAREHARMFESTQRHLFQTPETLDRTLLVFNMPSLGRTLTSRALPCAGAMASSGAAATVGETSNAQEELEFLKWPIPAFEEEKPFLVDTEVSEELAPAEAVRLMYMSDSQHASDDVKARLAFIAAGYTPLTDSGSQALNSLWHSWVASNLGPHRSWSETVRQYITAGNQLLLGLEPDLPEQQGAEAGQTNDTPKPDGDGDLPMADTDPRHTPGGAAIPPHPSLDASAGPSHGHQQVLRGGVFKLKLDLSASGSSDPQCFQRVDTEDDGGATLRELRQRWMRCLNACSKQKAHTLSSVSAEDVTQFLKRVRLDACKLLENAELGDGIRYPDLDAEHEMVAIVGLRIMETKLVASIQTHLPKPLSWEGLATAVNTQVASQRKPSYFYALTRDARTKVDYKGGDNKWSAFMNVYRERFETFAEQVKCTDKAEAEQVQITLTFANLPYNIQDEVIDRMKEKFPGRFFPPTLAALTEMVQTANTDLENLAAQAQLAQKRAASTSRGGSSAATPRGKGRLGNAGGGRGTPKPSDDKPAAGRGRGDRAPSGRGGWGRGFGGRRGGGWQGGRGRDDKKHTTDAKDTDAAKKQKK